jgi:hypothetical protein
MRMPRQVYFRRLPLLARISVKVADRFFFAVVIWTSNEFEAYRFAGTTICSIQIDEW